MNEFILRASTTIIDAKTRATDKVRRMATAENGDIVQTIIIIALFVVACIVVGGLIVAAIRTQGANTATCIKNANKLTPDAACTGG